MGMVELGLLVIFLSCQISSGWLLESQVGIKLRVFSTSKKNLFLNTTTHKCMIRRVNFSLSFIKVNNALSPHSWQLHTYVSLFDKHKNNFYTSRHLSSSFFLISSLVTSTSPSSPLFFSWSSRLGLCVFFLAPRDDLTKLTVRHMCTSSRWDRWLITTILVAKPIKSSQMTTPSIYNLC